MPAYDLNGKVALVTGAARGIGFETARQLHLRGASVAVVDLDAEQAREAAERIGERALGIGADVTDAGAMMAAVAETVERFGGLDVAVANAGIAPPTATTARTMPAEEWERVVEVNLLGVWHTVRAALPQIVRAQRPARPHRLGRRLRQRHRCSAPTRSAKAGVEAARAARCAPSWRRSGASATVAYFGWVDTEMVREGARPPAGRQAAPGNAAEVPAQADHPRRGRGGHRARHRGAGAAGLRARAGGATSRRCAASSTRCSTGARSATRRSPHDPVVRGRKAAKTEPAAR